MTEKKKPRPKPSSYERALCTESKRVLSRTGLWSDDVYAELQAHIRDMFNGEGDIKLFLNLDPGTIERAREKLKTRPDLIYITNELGGISMEVVMWVLGR